MNSFSKTSADSLLDATTLQEKAALLREDYQKAQPFPHAVIDDFFAPDALEEVLDEFPTPGSAPWRQHYHAHSRKLALNDWNLFGPQTRALLNELNGPVFLEFLQKLTGIENLIPDPYLEGGGLHQIERGGFLDIHADFNFHPKWKLHRRLNLIVYLNKDWKEEYAGHLELWDKKMSACVKKVLPVFNRCVLFSTLNDAFHGHPQPLSCPPDRMRRSLALYYYTMTRPEAETSRPHSSMYQNPQTKKSSLTGKLKKRFSPIAGALARRAGSLLSVFEIQSSLARFKKEFIERAPEKNADADSKPFRRRLVRQFERIHQWVICAHQEAEMLILAESILTSKLPGPIVELGCFKGGSSAKLSLVAAACKRKLYIYDSFEGLPQPGPHDSLHENVGGRKKNHQRGDYRGSLEEVKANIQKWGDLSVVEFVKGMYHDSLKDFNLEPSLVFMDVELIDSARECVQQIWPRLLPGAKFFTHESGMINFIQGLLDPSWWEIHLNSTPPILYGAGYGLGNEARNLAFMIKG